MLLAMEKTWSDEELRRKVGQLFIVGFHGQTPSENIKYLITSHHVGAVILFARNIVDAAQLETLTRSLQEIAASAGHVQPLFIGIDQEGGLVTRIRAPIATQMPGAMALGATGSCENAFEASSATAEMLQSFGINFNYAPIADVNSEPKNPIIGVRSPSDDPETVGRFVSAAARALRQGGIVPCVKHFPGHGDTAVDSHHGLPVINKSRAQLDDCELVPFRRAAAEEIESIMTAHIALPALGGEENLPASLDSKAIAILREDFKYDGLVVSDCLEMDGVRATFGTENGAVMALRAGTDCVMICHTMTAQIGAIEKVVEAVKSGEIAQEAIERSLDRLTKLKQRYLVNPASRLSEPFNREAMNSKHVTIAANIYAKSATVVRSSPGSLPISKSESRNIVFLSPEETPLSSGVVDSGEEKTREPCISADFLTVLRAYNSSVIDQTYYNEESINENILSVVDQASTVILCTRNGNLSPYQKRMGVELGQRLGDKLISIATCDPYDFLEDEVVKNYIVIYEPTVPAFKAAMDFIFGDTNAQGRLPVRQRKKKINIQPFDKEHDLAALSNLWIHALPEWKVPDANLTRLIDLSKAKHFVVYSGANLVAFSVSYISSGLAQIAVMAVAPTHQGQGIGTALITHTRKSWALDPQYKSFGIGTLGPRFWPGVPLSLPSAVSFFRHRGFHADKSPSGRDLFKDIRNFKTPERVENDIRTHGLRFAPWSAETYKDCKRAQAQSFRGPGWISAYKSLAETGQYHEAMVVFDGSGAQVGWALMSSPEGMIARDFAFLSLLGKDEGVDGKKVGVIACVGVDVAARGKGIGLALISKAVEDMKRRGMEGVMIEWVYLRGFYEKLGFEPVWEYQDFTW